MMDMLPGANSLLQNILSSSPSTGADNPAPHPSFPQFSRLPQELRLKIWGFALEPRLLRLHLHIRRPWPRDNNTPDPPVEDGSHFDPRWHPRFMTITSCNDDYFNCSCSSEPVFSRATLPLPTVLLASHESRDFSIRKYVRRLEDEYDSHGHTVSAPIPSFMKAPLSSLPTTGVILNPEIDTIMLSVNIASSEKFASIHHFTTVAAQQIPQVRKVILELRIFIPSYKCYQWGHYEWWKQWIRDGWWIPGKALVRVRGLKEVVVVRPKPKKYEKLFPGEWEERCKEQWREKLLKLEETWPVDWKGELPLLRFVRSMEEAD